MAVEAESKPHKLLVLDVNGLLIDTCFKAEKKNINRQPDGRANNFYIYERPFCREFVQFCLENFVVGVWSSARMHNVEALVQHVFGEAINRLAFIWDQSSCTNTGMKHPLNKYKPVFLKELKKLWEKKGDNLPWEIGDYGPSNTLLLDDSPYKASCNPAYTGLFPDTYEAENSLDDMLGPFGAIRLYLQKLTTAPDVQQFVKSNPFGQKPMTAKLLTWSSPPATAPKPAIQNIPAKALKIGKQNLVCRDSLSAYLTGVSAEHRDSVLENDEKPKDKLRERYVRYSQYEVQNGDQDNTERRRGQFAFSALLAEVATESRPSRWADEGRDEQDRVERTAVLMSRQYTKDDKNEGVQYHSGEVHHQDEWGNASFTNVRGVAEHRHPVRAMESERDKQERVWRTALSTNGRGMGRQDEVSPLESVKKREIRYDKGEVQYNEREADWRKASSTNERGSASEYRQTVQANDYDRNEGGRVWGSTSFSNVGDNTAEHRGPAWESRTKHGRYDEREVQHGDRSRLNVRGRAADFRDQGWVVDGERDVGHNVWRTSLSTDGRGASAMHGGSVWESDRKSAQYDETENDRKRARYDETENDRKRARYDETEAQYGERSRLRETTWPTYVRGMEAEYRHPVRPRDNERDEGERVWRGALPANAGDTSAEYRSVWQSGEEIASIPRPQYLAGDHWKQGGRGHPSMEVVDRWYMQHDGGPPDSLLRFSNSGKWSQEPSSFPSMNASRSHRSWNHLSEPSKYH